MTCHICGRKSVKTATISSGRFVGTHKLCSQCYKANGSLDDNHGGKRVGAGRPKSEPTKMVRVPVGAESIVKELIASYKTDSDNIFILDGSEYFLIKTHLKRKKVSWLDGRGVSGLTEPEPIHLINEFCGDELLACFARKGIVKP